MQRNLTFDLIGHARARPDAPALLLPGRTISYRALDALVWRCARHLHGQGVRAGQVVGLTCAEELVLVLVLLALARLGATAYSIPRSATALQRRQMAAQARVAGLVSDDPERFDAGVASLKLNRQALEAGTDPIDETLLCATPDAPWLLITGSGSSGRPKLIPLTHAQACARSQLGAEALQLTPADRVATLSHFDFSTAKFRLHEALWAGAACALEVWDGAATVRHCARHRLSVLYGTVFHAEQLLDALAPDTLDALPGIRAFELTASTVSTDLRQRVRRALTPNLHVRYGINEAGPVALARPPEVHEVAGSVGRPLGAVELEIVDGHGQPLPPGMVGRVRLRSPALVDGYRDDAQATRAHFEHGWFLPGDLGRLTPDGQLIYCGRADQMMIMNGINIYPAEIEQVMTAHPEVADAAAMPLRHRIHQDVPVCAVVTRPGASASEQTLLAYARERLGAHGPQRVLRFDAIPRNHEGKLVRAELAGLIAARLGRAHAQVQAQVQAAGPASATGVTPPCRQRLGQFEHALALPARLELAGLDRWLVESLQMPSSDLHSATDLPQPAGQWLWRALLLARVLLQASRIPVFDAPRIVSLSRQGGPAGVASAVGQTESWRARIAWPLVEQLPAALYAEALDAALGLCAWAGGHALNDANRQAFFELIQQQGIARLSRGSPCGKSTVPLLRVAHELGMPFLHLGAGVFQLGWGSKACRLDRSASGRDSALGARLAQSKALTARLLRTAGLPAPRQQLVAHEAAALAAARQLGWPVVLKPADRDRGEGVTVDVADDAALKSAFAVAQRLSISRQVIVERQVAGVCHRLLIAQGRLLYAVKRLPISVTADGRHSIAELVEAELRRQQRLVPWLRSPIKPLDELAHAALAAAGYAVSSVPPAGARVALRRIESTEWGGVDEEVGAQVHPENLRVALEAAQLFGLEIAGIDLITPDIARPWFENGAILNEVNFSPLLGGGEISRRHLARLLDALVPERGRIPVEVFVGGESAWESARQRWQALLASGLRACLTDRELTLGPSGEPWHMPLAGCAARARALALSARVDAIVLVVAPVEFEAAELPFGGVERIVRVKDRIDSRVAPPDAGTGPSGPV